MINLSLRFNVCMFWFCVLLRSQQALFSAHVEVEDPGKEKLLKAGKSIYMGIRKMHEVLNMDSQMQIDMMSHFS